MAKMLYKTKDNTDPKGKPRVYFTCHPEDFAGYFEKIKEDIFATHNVAIYYTEDMTEAFDEAHLETDLGQMNLFVVPVTFRLLAQPNRAVDFDIAYAKEQHIPILPFMMEPGIDELYSQPEKFDKRQYLNPFSTDMTEVSYKDKLKKYLESTLISDEMAKRIRAAFEAYIFLSYRKKDRQYANELMKLIHKNPECRDIAIWYDEFLTPGESFADSIQKALDDSRLFALLVTPNLLEEPDGKPNFVMAEEYPAAHRAGKEIFPAEMVRTDHAALASKFPDIPDCSDPQNEAAFRERLLQAIQRVAIASNNHDPEHNFLIGLAYLEGIDVEVNRKRGLELITSAAEDGLPEAMQMLSRLYGDQSSAEVNYPQALMWAERYTDRCMKTYGEHEWETMVALEDLASLYTKTGNHAKAQKTAEAVYSYRCEVQGEDHADTMRILKIQADAHLALGNDFNAKDLYLKLYTLRYKTMGKTNPETLAAMGKVLDVLDIIEHASAKIEKMKSTYEKAKEVKKEIYRDLCKTAEETIKKGDTEDMRSLEVMAAISSSLREHATALYWKETVYTRRRDALGKEHPDTMRALSALGNHYFDRTLYLTSLEIEDILYDWNCKVYGKEHPETLHIMRSMAMTCSFAGKYRRMLQISQVEYELRSKNQGEDHPQTVNALDNIARAYSGMGKYKKALEYYQQVYDHYCKRLGVTHGKTRAVLRDLADTYAVMDNYKAAYACLQEAYTGFCASYGEKHFETRKILSEMKSLQEESEKPRLVRNYARIKERLETCFWAQESNFSNRRWRKKAGRKVWE